MNVKRGLGRYLYLHTCGRLPGIISCMTMMMIPGEQWSMRPQWDT